MKSFFYKAFKTIALLSVAIIVVFSAAFLAQGIPVFKGIFKDTEGLLVNLAGILTIAFLIRKIAVGRNDNE